MLHVPEQEFKGRPHGTEKRSLGIQQMRHVLLVLEALGVEHLRVGHGNQPDGRRPRPRVGLRVIDRDVDRQMTVIGPMESLSDFAGVRERTARRVEPLIVAKLYALDDELIAVPAPD